MEAREYVAFVSNTFIDPLQIVHRTLYYFAAADQNMGVDHGGLHVIMAKKFKTS